MHRGRTRIARLVLALLAVLAAVSSVAGTAMAEQRRPTVTLSVPAELTRGEPALAKGRVAPPQPGRVVLQAWSAAGWRLVGGDKLRTGRFRISFVPKGSLPSRTRLRATLMRGGSVVAKSAARRIQVGTASVELPAPAPPTVQQPTTSAVSGSQPSGGSTSGDGGTPPTGEPPPGETPTPEEPPPEEPPPPPPPGDVYWGAWIGSHLTGTPAPWDMNAVGAFEQLAEKPLSLIEFSSPFADCDQSPCTYFTFPWDPFTAVRAYGAIPFFSWASQSIPGSPDQPDFQLADLIAGDHDDYIRAWATQAADWGHPFFLRFDWEMNGDWFPWGEGANGNQPGEFVAAWRHVHDVFSSVGATNATWVWCPYANKLSTYASLYPGDAYVDWTCLDGYNWGTNPAAPYGWKSFDDQYGKAYAKLTESLAPSKPVVIGEIGSSEYGGSKATWIEEMFGALPLRFPKVRGLVWFETLSNNMDWPIESSELARAAFAAGIADDRYRDNEFGTIGAAPVPPP